ncbi:hypothetical protein CYMTET_5706 [Cymbomonas tetramitiformis]|uniref:Uncharacterized protein n=1 Tax=Cymbomonas tetramitiformis TaxID=36881 RepID=A0AAE0GYW4_9CHLO|nr:hypothetical protein CYMTET_5706 [Cymbomonas tetramitiformis]
MDTRGFIFKEVSISLATRWQLLQLMSAWKKSKPLGDRRLSAMISPCPFAAIESGAAAISSDDTASPEASACASEGPAWCTLSHAAVLRDFRQFCVFREPPKGEGGAANPTTSSSEQELVAAILAEPIYEAGKVVGYIVNGLLQLPGVKPPKVLDFGMYSMARLLKEEGKRIINLGITGLNGMLPNPEEDAGLREHATFIFENVKHSYSFQGLAHKKENYSRYGGSSVPRHLITLIDARPQFYDIGIVNKWLGIRNVASLATGFRCLLALNIFPEALFRTWLISPLFVYGFSAVYTSTHFTRRHILLLTTFNFGLLAVLARIVVLGTYIISA